MPAHTGLRRLLIAIGAVVAAALALVAGSILVSVPVSGVSMTPTLSDGDRIVVDPWSDPEIDRFDIVVAKFSTNGAQVVKRVIGLPGDRVKIEKVGIRTGIVSVQPGGMGPWQIVDNPAWNARWGPTASNCCTAAGKMTNVVTPQLVPDGMLFLIGDNFAASDDSRGHGWAPVELVRNTAAWRVYPIGAIGRIPAGVTLRPAT
ncbi:MULTISPECIES: signal peptidase I [Antrihabitans]|uniref:Signal peptidase I n=2 Tax=Antrihabitans TaxID=2799491 RepID=A0A934U567_9NOCA|nr:signal peptidase I [Antrihabitans stalagmiti]MBJ8340503.1 signal peptidase I [Antrihabitans stalagmiti]